jgi:hypothetical protein
MKETAPHRLKLAIVLAAIAIALLIATLTGTGLVPSTPVTQEKEYQGGM